MSNKNDKVESILTALFESREENLYALNEKDKEKIRNSLDSYIDKINIIGAYENEKFYKIRLFRYSKFNIGVCM